MAEEKKLDLVTTYVVGDRGIVRGTDEALNNALASGYRVVSVIPCTLPMGGQSPLGGSTTVTVVLTAAEATLFVPCKS